MSNTSAARVRHECYKNDMSARRVKNCDFETTRVKTYFHTPILAVLANERLQRGEKFHFQTVLWKYLVPMPRCV